MRSRAIALGIAFMLISVPASANPDRWRGEGWKTDFSRTTVEWSEILSGGPPRDGIPSIDDPRFEKASTVKGLAEREPVIRLQIDDEIRAYPLSVLTWHEIVNDEFSGQPVAITYCPLCNASLVFDRRLDGQVLEFGTTGKLRNSDLVMYDRQTESWWQQFTGEAIAGTLTGRRLRLVPSRIVAFGEFAKANPDAKVLVPNDRNFRDYGRNPYMGYDTAAAPFLYRGDLPDNIPAMSRVVVIRTDGQPIVVSLDMVRKSGFSKDGYEVAFQAGVASALDTAAISQGRDVGTVRVTKNGEDVPHDVTFAFVAHAFHPEAAIITE